MPSTGRQEFDVAFPSLAGPWNDLLIPFDPQRSLETIWGTVEVYAAADPKVAAARTLLQDSLDSATEEDVDAVGAVLWATYRRHLCAGGNPQRMRAWISNGNRVLTAVHLALEGSLRPTAFAELAASTRRLEASDASDTGELEVARAELAQISATNIGPVKVLPFLVGVGHSYIEHYLAKHPSPPPEPIMDDDDD